MTKPRMLREEDHGLGIHRSVPAALVEAFDEAMWNTAKRAVALGVSFRRGGELLEAAMDTAFSGGRRPRRYPGD
jgi:hypothetical protein